MNPRLLLVAILIAAAALRLVGLGSIPSGFTPDEASQGYSAYSVLKTGRDEWGEILPLLSFKSFLDYKAPLQTYLMVPTIALFGLNEFAVRLPSALLGILAVFAVYQLTFTLAGKFLDEKDRKNAKSIALLAALVMAISPWHIQFSRMALEAGPASAFILLGLWLFLKGFDKPKVWILSALFFSASLYTYHSAKIFVPLFILSLGLIFWRNKISLKKAAHFLLPLLILAGPALVDMFFGRSASRGADLLIYNLNDVEEITVLDQRFYSPLNRISKQVPALFHNKLTFVWDRLVDNYFSYFNLSYWFTEGGRETTYSIIPGRGLLYTWMALPFLAGLLLIVRRYFRGQLSLLLLIWFLLAAIPAAITKEGYRPNRASAYLGLLEIVIAFGGYYLWQLVGKYRSLLVGFFTVVCLLGLGFYLNDYAFAGQIKYPDSMSFGWRSAVEYIKNNGEDYEHILIQKSGQPQAMIAFYLKLDPRTFQAQTTTWATLAETERVTYLDQLETYQLDRYTFEPLNFPEDRKPNTLYLASSKFELLPKDRTILYQVLSGADKVQFELFTF